MLVEYAHSNSVVIVSGVNVTDLLVRQPDVVGTALSFTAVLFSQPTILSSRAEDAHQIYMRRSVLGEALICNSEISPTPPLILQGVKKC